MVSEMSYFKPTLQTKFNKEGNCLAACIATLFPIEIEDVPFLEEDDWIFPLSEWAASHIGKFIIPARLNDLDTELFCGSLVMTIINSDNPLVERHVVIAQGKKIIFDPMVGETNRQLLQDTDPVFLIVSDVRGYSR